MILVGLALAIIAGLLLGRLMGFMAGEFMVRLFFIVARWVASVFGAVIGWGRRLP